MIDAFRKILKVLSTEDIEEILVDDIIQAFPLGIVMDDFDDGKTLKCIEEVLDDKGTQIGVILEGFAPAGAQYTKHYHDGVEEMVTLSGLAMETVTPIHLKPLKNILLPKHRVHGYKVIKDWRFVCKISKSD